MIETAYNAGLRFKQPLQEYPRPQMVRNSYINLNGTWQYAITDTYDVPAEWDGDIWVPFSPECPLSGVEKTLTPNKVLWYKLDFNLWNGFIVDRVLLHFGAVDQCCCVSLNGTNVGSHTGGMLPFYFDITDQLVAESNQLIVCVSDQTETTHFSRGRQKLNHGGLWHTSQSGIWQTVWLESVPKQYIKNIYITPHYDESMVEVLIECNDGSETLGEIEIFAGATLSKKTSYLSGTPVFIPMQGFISWYPKRPFLYNLRAFLGDDTIESYFGMRKFATSIDESGNTRLTINNKPFFQCGILDQGFYPDSFLTPPSEKAMLDDLQYVKDSGFTTIRKHGKFEPLRWYYHCDRLGLLVWQDFPNGGDELEDGLSRLFFCSKRNLPDHVYNRFGRENKYGREHFLKEVGEAVATYYNCVSIAAWVPFHEGWGQFKAAEIAKALATSDTTRWVDHASGWHDQNAGHFYSLHAEGITSGIEKPQDERAFVLSACGSFGLQLVNHFYGKNPYASILCNDHAQLELLIDELWEYFLALKKDGLAAFVFTQLSDTEDEVSGFLTSDRLIAKISSTFLNKLNSKLLD